MIGLLLSAAARADIAIPMPPERGATYPSPALDSPLPPAWVWGVVAVGLAIGVGLWWRHRGR